VPNPEWLKAAQTLAEMVRELRKAELHVDEIKANIRRFLRARGCRRNKPWRTTRSVKDKHSSGLGPVPDKCHITRLDFESVFNDQHFHANDKLDVGRNGESNKLNGDIAH